VYGRGQLIGSIGLALRRRITMATRTPHRPSTEQRPFVFGCSTAVFPADEFAALTEMGSILEALAAGELPPTTPEQRHFLKVDRDEADPRTVAERAWLRLKGRREFERESQGKAPVEAPQNYGMVEFDADRCWW
jgi:uncharacterized protein YifE (UPF0438 family)